MEAPDPEEFVCGGCSIAQVPPEVRCIKCNWEGNRLEAEKATRLRRFIWTEEDGNGITFSP